MCMALYRRCEQEGVGISVMKPYDGGRLLDEKRSPFPFALTPYQCVQYALDKPGVLSVLAGVGNRERLKEYLDFLDVPADEKDYSCLGEVSPAEEVGACVYRPLLGWHSVRAGRRGLAPGTAPRR